jgi:hypothetical protein
LELKSALARLADWVGNDFNRWFAFKINDTGSDNVLLGQDTEHGAVYYAV